jgi:hypothetical protein
MNYRAIVTLAIGAETLGRWERLCAANWQRYAETHGYDVICLPRVLDDSERARGRSPAWQKCLVFEQPEVAGYEQVVWLDTDIFLNVRTCPDFATLIAPEMMGAVNSFADPSPEENQQALARLWAMLRAQPGGSKVAEYTKPEDIYARYGEPVQPLSLMLNTGVMVVSPARHSAIFRRVYDNYEDRGPSSYYENVPLSYEMVQSGQLQCLDSKCNHLWTWSKLLHYPFLMRRRYARSARLDRLIREISWQAGGRKIARQCASTALANCHVLHFAGYASEMEWVDLELAEKLTVEGGSLPTA